MLTHYKEVNMKQTPIPLTDEEKANMQLLKITDGIVTGVTDHRKLLGTLVLPEGITEIGMFTFIGCSGLTNIFIPDSVTEIADEVFYFCGLIHIVIPDTVTKIGQDAFADCSSLKSVIIPNLATEIGAYAFSGCTNLTVMVIPNGVTEIGDGVFSWCKNLTNITVDDANTAYCSENNILYTKNKKKVIAVAGALKGHIVIPDSVTEIGAYAFSGCSGLTNVTISDNVTVISESTFSGCSGLTSIIIPESVTEINMLVFDRCRKLKTVVIKSTVIKDIDKTAFKNVHANIHFTVKTDAVKALLKKNPMIRDEQITVEQNL